MPTWVLPAPPPTDDGTGELVERWPTFELLLTATRGDEAGASEALLAATYRDLFRAAVGFGLPYEEAKDATQEAVIRIWRSLGTYDPSCALFRTWAHRILLNYIINEHRSRTRLGVAIEAFLSLANPPDPEPDLVMAARQVLARFLLTLNVRQRLVWTLVEVQEFSIAEVAGVLDCSVRTVHYDLAQARAARTRFVEALDG